MKLFVQVCVVKCDLAGARADCEVILILNRNGDGARWIILIQIVFVSVYYDPRLDMRIAVGNLNGCGQRVVVVICLECLSVETVE